jgi:hypothetical protein
MLDLAHHASHRCHNPTCIHPPHICVESKTANEARKDCAKRIRVRTTVGGTVYMLEPLGVCLCHPPCIYRIEDRIAIATTITIN